MKSTVRLSITAGGALCRDTDAGATRLICPIGEEVPKEFEGDYLAKFGAGDASEKDVTVPTFVHELEVGKLEVFEGGAVHFHGKVLAKASKVDLVTVADQLAIEDAEKLNKEQLVLSITEAAQSLAAKKSEEGDAN